MSDKNIISEDVVEIIKNYLLNIEKINSVYIFRLLAQKILMNLKNFMVQYPQVNIFREKG